MTASCVTRHPTSTWGNTADSTRARERTWSWPAKWGRATGAAVTSSATSCTCSQVTTWRFTQPRYVVTDVLHVDAESVGVMESTGNEQVTLITCRLCNVEWERLVVVAVPKREPGDEVVSVA